MNCETSHSGNYIIYTDGSYKKYNSGNVKASCAYIVLDDNHEVILKGKSAISDTKEKLLNSVGVELERFHHLLNTHRKSSYNLIKRKKNSRFFSGIGIIQISVKCLNCTKNWAKS